jgi:hypothetical protein
MTDGQAEVERFLSDGPSRLSKPPTTRELVALLVAFIIAAAFIALMHAVIARLNSVPCPSSLPVPDLKPGAKINEQLCASTVAFVRPDTFVALLSLWQPA